MDAREQIRDKVKSIAADPHVGKRYEMYTDDLIAIVKEALLSGEVVQAVAREVAALDDRFGEGAAIESCARGMSLAFDNAFGSAPRQEGVDER